MALIDELKERRERQTESLATIYEAIRERQEYLRGVEFELEDLDRAIAALEPAPTLDAQAGVEVETPPGHEPNAIIDPRVSLKAEPETDALAEFMQRPGATRHDRSELPPVSDEVKVEVLYTGEGYPPHTKMGDAEDRDWFMVDAYRIISEPSEETLPGFDEADAESDALGEEGIVATIEEVVGWNDAQNAGFEGSFDEYVEAAAEPASVLNDPELQAAVDRANASIAQDEPQPYVGCIDEELERDYDAAKARTTIKHEDAKKPFFAFLGAKPKPEEVC